MEEDLLLDEQRIAIKECKKVLAQLQSGEVTEVIGVAIKPNGNYRMFGGATASRTQMAGILLEAAIVRLQQQNDDDENEDDDG